MRLNEAILARIADWRPEPGRQTLFVPDAGSGWTVSLAADRNDELGCLAWELALRRAGAPPEGTDALRAWAERAARRVTGLPEPLTVIEVDAQRGEAMLRSHEPTRRGDVLYYHQVILQGSTTATLRRYQSSPAGERPRVQQATFPITHEALVRVIDGLTADD